jgi:hypothetical protein
LLDFSLTFSAFLSLHSLICFVFGHLNRIELDIYVEWHDGPLLQFFSDLIGDLRDEVCKLRVGERVPKIEVIGASDQQAGTK